MECVIQARGLYHTYMADTPWAHVSLQGVDLTVRQGQVVALIGVTGSGKSTLLQHLNGLLRPQQGRVWVNGHDLADPGTDLCQIRRTVGLVFEQPENQLFEQYVGDDVAYGPRMAGLRGPDLRERVRWAMELVGLDFAQFKDRLVFALSGGERRKVGLAGVLALRPQVLLLDEPTAGLDSVARLRLLSTVNGLREQGITVVIATHNMDDVAALADRVYVLDGGRVALQGPPRAVFAQVERLEEMGLAVPSAVSIMAALRAHDLVVPADVLTLDQAEAAILAVLTRRRSSTTGVAQGEPG